MGSGFRTFQSGEVLTSSNVQNYLMDQAITVFAGTAARGSAIASPETGMVSYRTDGTADSKREGFEFYDGASWTRLVPASTSPALVVVKAETTFSAASSITADNVFTSTYRNYKLVINYTTTGTANIRFRVRASGSSVSTTTYNEQELTGADATAGASRGASGTSVSVARGSNGSFSSSAEVLICNPAIAIGTTLVSTNVGNVGAYTAPVSALYTGNNSNATAYDGFELFLSSGSTTGNYTLYGLATA